MKLSTRCRYATLALFDIAFHSDGDPTQVRQIAERQDIPARFLEQIFQDLRRAEIVDGKRGRNGGYFLRKPAAEITLGDVVRATEGPLEMNFCSNDEGGPLHSACPKDSRCIPAGVWYELGERLAAVFDDYSIADLVTRAEEAGIHRGGAAYMYFI